MSRTPSPDADAGAMIRSLRQALDGGPPVVLGASPERVPEGVALVLRTSGSTSGSGRPVALSSAALRASATATHARLGGVGQWVLTLPPHHIAGVQVLVRSIVAGIAPVLASPGPFDPRSLAGTLARADGQRRYVSLVPTQLHRVVAEGGAAMHALAGVDAVLLGGAAAPAALLARAREAGITVVTSYGMTETCGGCVYDGVPLAGVQVRLSAGRVMLGGPVVAEGYLDDGEQPFEEADGTRWFRTSDIGEIDGDGRLRVLGRADEVLITGGVNVHPAAVERALAGLAEEVLVVGVPHPEWGQLVTAVVVGDASLAQLRAAAGGGPGAPRALVRVTQIPTRGPGKPDRRATAALARAAVDDGSAELR